MALHPFDRAIQTMPEGTEWFCAHTDDNYWNMNGPFGGIVAATLLNAALQTTRNGFAPVSMTVNFCAPQAPGALRIRCREARAGKSVVHQSLEMFSADGQVVSTASLVTARRSDTLSHLAATPPARPEFKTLQDMVPDPHFAWLDRYQFRFIDGELKLDAVANATNPSAVSMLWVADHPVRALDWLSLVALCDVFFLRIFHLRNELALAGTVSMTAQFHASADDLARQGKLPLLGRAWASVFSRNFFDQQAQLWSYDGQLLATSTQMAWFKE
jgi:acyl-CoA thioesterase